MKSIRMFQFILILKCTCLSLAVAGPKLIPDPAVFNFGKIREGVNHVFTGDYRKMLVAGLIAGDHMRLDAGGSGVR